MPFDVDGIGAIDHDFGDIRIFDQIFQRSEAQRFIDDLLTQAREIFGRSVKLTLRNQFGGDVFDGGAQLGEPRRIGVRESGRDEVYLAQQRFMRVALEDVAFGFERGILWFAVAVAVAAHVPAPRASPIPVPDWRVRGRLQCR